jgi:ADP-ribosylglycohydrolase
MQGPDQEILSKSLGCMLGGAAADAVGGLGQITSATQMSLFTAEGLLRGQVRFATKGIPPAYSLVVAHAYLRWLQTQFPDVDFNVHKDGWVYTVPGLHLNRTPDRASVRALKLVRESMKDQYMTLVKSNNQNRGSGALMRVAPIGLMSATIQFEQKEQIDWLFNLGCEVAQITHGHPEGYLPAGAFVLIIACLKQGLPLSQAVKLSIEVLRSHPGSITTVRLLRKVLRLHPDGLFKPMLREVRLGRGCYGHEALALAVLFALTADSFNGGIEMATSHDGDCSALAAITGNLLGIMNGFAAIDISIWREDPALLDAIKQVATDLVSYPWWDMESDPVWERYPGY